MEQEQYQDAEFNMRAVFYHESKNRSEDPKREQGKQEPNSVQRLRDNVGLHQKPLSIRTTTQAG
ncbi:MAG: hypothetical protein JW883_08700 [Deltaproteobacteria bacterium]|nr:hypothetical protein [Deltaproteobacteria bacterium]